MPLALLAIGALAVITGIKGNQATVMAQLESDLTGSGSFIYWIAAIIVLAIIGRVAGFPDAAKAFIALIIVVYVVSQNGLWTQATTALAGLNTGTTATTATTTQPTAATAAAANIPVPASVSTSAPATATN